MLLFLVSCVSRTPGLARNDPLFPSALLVRSPSGLAAAVINRDDASGRTLGAGLAPSITLIGTSSRAHPETFIAADEISAQSRGMKFRLHVANAVHPVQSALIGRFNLGNLLAVAGVLHEARKSTRLNSSH